MTDAPLDQDWIDRYAEALARATGAEFPLRKEDAEVVLELARLVAHGTERRNAPLAAFLAGRFVQQQLSAGADPERSLGEAVARAREQLP